jgi:phosphoribosyl 1,2-cyclic phosphodiesterase
VTVWGSRGSIPSPGPDTVRFGGNTSCVEVRNAVGECIVLDGGTGARRLGQHLATEGGAVHVLLSHLHMDHIQGLGFFAPLYTPGREVHIWGPASTMHTHRNRLVRYLSPPLFPVWLDELPCDLTVHSLTDKPFDIGGFRVSAEMICHPGTTYGFRLESDGVSLVYMPDHEPALMRSNFPARPEWVSGSWLAAEADLLIHDSQYTDADYATRMGWGHSGLSDLVEFARMTQIRALMPFHHEPAYDDHQLDDMLDFLGARLPDVELIPGSEGLTHVILSPEDRGDATGKSVGVQQEQRSRP